MAKHEQPSLASVPCPSSLGSALGTIAYSAPETFAHNQLKKPSDVYAFGIMREWQAALAAPGFSTAEPWLPGLAPSLAATAAYRAPVHMWRAVASACSSAHPCLLAVWEMFYCREPYDGLLEGQICVGVTGGWLSRLGA